MKGTERPKPPLAGIVYGNFVNWIVLIGLVVGIIGLILYLTGVNQLMDSKVVLSELWAGKSPAEIEKAAGRPLQGYWFLHNFYYSDGVSMLGVGICCVAAVIGLWASCITMLTKRGRIGTLFFILAVVVSIILTLSVVGKISIH